MSARRLCPAAATTVNWLTAASRCCPDRRSRSRAPALPRSNPVARRYSRAVTPDEHPMDGPACARSATTRPAAERSCGGIVEKLPAAGPGSAERGLFSAGKAPLQDNIAVGWVGKFSAGWPMAISGLMWATEAPRSAEPGDPAWVLPSTLRITDHSLPSVRGPVVRGIGV